MTKRERRFEIRTPEGQLVAVHVRLDHADGSKSFRWERPDGALGLGGVRTHELPLYRCEAISAAPPDAPAILCEGETATDALAARGFLALGTLTGAASTPGLASLEVLRDRDVTLWPDHDDAGFEHMRRASRLLRGIAKEVRVLRWGAETGDDAADFFARGGTAELLGRMLADAPAFDGATMLAVTATPGTAGDPSPEPIPEFPALSEKALYGLAGDVVRAIEPHTEADPAAVLLQFLIAFGNAAGAGPFFSVESDRHRVNLFAVIAGDTSRSRKGTSWGHVRRLFEQADADWAARRVGNGLASGEGLIWAVRDQIEEWRPPKKGEQGHYVVVDPGESDKRLLVVEPELARTLKVMDRQGSTLSPLLRSAWDGGSLRSMTKNSPVKATNPHISVVGHVTISELRYSLAETELANGFANRFLLAVVRRSKELPEGGTFGKRDNSSLGARLKGALAFARSAGEMTRDAEARRVWHEVYHELSGARTGLFGAMVSRAEAQVLRVSMVYALLDRSEVVRPPHLLAALAVWEFAEWSARYLFGEKLGNETADEIVEALKGVPGGLTRTDISGLFSRHKGPQVAAALAELQRLRIAKSVKVDTNGRPAELWVLVGDAGSTSRASDASFATGEK